MCAHQWDKTPNRSNVEGSHSDNLPGGHSSRAVRDYAGPAAPGAPIGGVTAKPLPPSGAPAEDRESDSSSYMGATSIADGWPSAKRPR
jgi:hypothetical protein